MENENIAPHLEKFYMDTSPGAKTVINGKEVDYYAGTSYFGLHGHPGIKAAVKKAVQEFGISPATGRTGFGNNHLIDELEIMASEFFNTEQSASFVSGYLGNLILLQGLNESYDKIFLDEDSHYSIKDAAHITQKPIIYYEHLNPDDLQSKLKANCLKSETPLIITDGIFPISGEIPPLPQYREIAQNYNNTIIIIDDAHAVGTIGPHGRGTCDHFQMDPIEHKIFANQTLSKAIGSHGGIIANTKKTIATLKSKVPVFRGSSSTPLPIVSASIFGLRFLKEHPELRQKLWRNTNYAKEKFLDLGFSLNQNQAPILCLRHSKQIKWKKLEKFLFKHNIAVKNYAKGEYAGANNGVGRICINANHEKHQIDHLVEKTKSYLQKHNKN